MNTEKIERFFVELTSKVDTAKREELANYQRFFAELAPRLETARALEVELDRHLARRFNVLDYVRTDELGLSKILADLFDPKGHHGQGTLFLQCFMEGLGKLTDWPDLSGRPMSVEMEKVITANRRIDIYVKMGQGKATHCLAIENKPYAEDQKDQVKDYLKYLDKRYSERFFLIYLSPRGEGPSDWSLPAKELGQWKERFAILPYCTVDSERDLDPREDRPDRFDDFLLSNSLADWFKKCRQTCDVDRLRWFLRDAEVFCQRSFGGQTMATGCETKALRDFLLSNPENMAIARAVYGSWPAIRDEICKDFFDQLRRRVETEVKGKLSKYAHDMCFGYSYWGGRRWADCFWLYRMSWRQHNESSSRGRTAICLEVEEIAPNGWLYGVRCPLAKERLSDHDKKLRERLVADLRNKLGAARTSSVWPWWTYVDERYRNWDDLVFKLHRECKDGDRREVMDYFVDLIVGAAEKIIPIIDEIEGDKA